MEKKFDRWASSTLPTQDLVELLARVLVLEGQVVPSLIRHELKLDRLLGPDLHFTLILIPSNAMTHRIGIYVLSG